MYIYGLDHDEGQITRKVPHTQHSPHTSLTLCPLHTSECNRKRHWVDPLMHSPYSDGQSGHPFPEEVAHTHHPPQVMPTSVEYILPVKTSAYHTNVSYNIQPNHGGSQTSVKRRGWGGEGRGKGGCGEVGCGSGEGRHRGGWW